MTVQVTGFNVVKDPDVKVGLTFDGHNARRGVLEVSANGQLTIDAVRQTFRKERS